jgi:hypothetical protein
MHIEAKATAGRLTDDLREEYIACLEKAFEHGLWVKTPRMPDQIDDGSLIKVKRPITCFTEWSLGQSLPHTTRYGRLGLGFPKQFVLERGGQPVIYVRDGKTKSPYVKGSLELAAFLQDKSLTRGLAPRQIDALRDHFEYVSHFAKSIRKPPAPRTKGPCKAVKSRPAMPTRVRDDFRRKFGGTLHYLEEREWRIVFDPSIKSHFVKSTRKPGQPEYYLPFKPGAELFTVALPDNRSVSIALSNRRLKSKLREWFYPENAPHVTLVSLQDVGTF